MGRRDKDRGSSRDVDYERSKESRKKKKSRRDDRDSDDDGEEDKEEDRRRRRREKERSRDPRGRKSKRDSSESPIDDSSSSADDDAASASSSDNERKYDKKRRKKEDKKRKKSSHKKDKKKKKKKRKHRDKEAKEDGGGDEHRSNKKRKRSRSEEDNDNEANKAAMKALERNYQLADALHDLLVYHPTVMATDTLPLLLIQLGGGTTLDLRQMTDRHAAHGLESVLKCMVPYGVVQENHTWQWKSPAVGPNKNRDERILLRIVRTLLNDIGFTMEAVQKHEQQEQEWAEAAANAPIEKEETSMDNNGNNDIQQKTMTLLQGFQNSSNNNNNKDAPSSLPGELGGLCNMILEGETISLEGLPDAKLRENLEHLFQDCGLEQCEMEDSDDDDDDDYYEDDDDKKKAPVSIGYGLPENAQGQERVKATLVSVMEACKRAAELPKKRAIKGPMPMPSNYVAPEESSDDEGPAPVGVAQKKRAPSMPKELVKQQAEMRERQLRGAVTGQEELMSDTAGDNQREEWMLVPGKFDFLASVKAGNPQRSRGFQAMSKADGGDEGGGRVVDPRVQAEMDAIMQAHTNARGPSLVEQHRMKKEEERQEKAAAGGKGNKGDWNWSRDKDLDAGRKVDTNALHQVLGGAVSDLKKKFQGGF